MIQIRMNPEPSTSSQGDNTLPLAREHDTDRRRQPIPPAINIKAIGISSIRDTLTGHRHSEDFAYARSDYLRGRVMVIGWLFAVLSPLWLAVDAMVLPPSALGLVMMGRVLLMIGLVATIVFAYYSRARILRERISAGLLLALPAAFYLLVLLSLPPGESHSLVGYSFIPFLLVATLSVFPFTLAESAAAGIAMLLLQVVAQQMGGTWMTAAGWQEIWLLAALLVVALAANYFHLGLLLRLYRQATHDPLTGLLNRGALMQHLKQIEIARTDLAASGGHPLPLSLLMLDLDHFKRINDTYGHSVGDSVLREFAHILRQQVRKSDVAARYGGEEFLVVLVGTGTQDAVHVAERIRQQTERADVRDHAGGLVPFTTSIGVAAFEPGDSLDDAIRRADDRLYKAKHQSRNRVVMNG